MKAAAQVLQGAPKIARVCVYVCMYVSVYLRDCLCFREFADPIDGINARPDSLMLVRDANHVDALTSAFFYDNEFEASINLSAYKSPLGPVNQYECPHCHKQLSNHQVISLALTLNRSMKDAPEKIKESFGNESLNEKARRDVEFRNRIMSEG